MSINKTVKADATLIEDFKIELHAGNHTLYIDQPPAMGGTDAGPNPLEFNLFSLVGCCVTIGNIVAKQKHLNIRKLSAHAEGDLNSEVFMGKNRDDRAGFQTIRVVLDIDADMTEEEKEAFAQEVSARCPVAENIVHPCAIKLSVN